MISEDCPAGYTLNAGGIPGRGQISLGYTYKYNGGCATATKDYPSNKISYQNILNVDKCHNLCELSKICRYFEYGSSDKSCHLSPTGITRGNGYPNVKCYEIKKNSIEDSVYGCSKRCNDEPKCCSFEYSQTEKICNLNKDCAPTSLQFKDYKFCVKGMCKFY